MSIAGILRRWVLVSAVTGVLALIQVPGVRAQAVPPSPAVSPAAVGSNQPVQMPPNPNPNQPVPTAPSPGPLNSPAMETQARPGRCPAWRPDRPGCARNGARDAPGTVPGTAPGIVPGAPPADPRRILVGSLDPGCDLRIALRRHLHQGRHGSLDAYDARRVLQLQRRMGHALRVSEVALTGTPRHGWVEARSVASSIVPGFLLSPTTKVSASHIITTRTSASTTIFVPLNRRSSWQFDYDFIVSDKGGTSNTYHGNTGDLTIHNRFQLSESDNFGQLFQLAVRVPTGAEDNGNGVASIEPITRSGGPPRQLGRARLDGPHGAHQPRQDFGLLVRTITSSPSAATSRVPTTAGSSNCGFTWSPTQNSTISGPLPVKPLSRCFPGCAAGYRSVYKHWHGSLVLLRFRRMCP